MRAGGGGGRKCKNLSALESVCALFVAHAGVGTAPTRSIHLSLSLSH